MASPLIAPRCDETTITPRVALFKLVRHPCYLYSFHKRMPLRLPAVSIRPRFAAIEKRLNNAEADRLAHHSIRFVQAFGAHDAYG
jgi:hypothetical protein